MTRYSVFDVFSDAPFGGNPLAVIHDAQELPEATLQKIAREFNFSETVFLYPPVASAHTARVRIFTPTMEIPFAGHPTIGTAVALAQAGAGPDMVLELGVGPIVAKATAERAEFHTPVPLSIMAEPDPALVAAALGLSGDDIRVDTHTPVLASVGLPFTITELKTREALARCVTDITAFRKGAALHEGALDFAQFAYVREGNHVDARMFAPLDNMPEDPATGSASAALGALLVKLSGDPVDLSILQGEDMGRPSQIGLGADTEGVTISGAACLVMSGTLHL
ncbi:PhzF family phenazine biosynthesis protein [Lentibacter algarum]|uniref:PhzF family phenazine biosynthesis protein n=1 Tax=Lentibacter algarum TaxID=576131 RepID=UPI001C09A4C1|nr:PhzF family phenazine biosynthesis protein [Lentibacter algarum]MBU2982788.1 PhzF family phenazine biosynthesis protein [Lentibacter algarum]